MCVVRDNLPPLLSLAWSAPGPAPCHLWGSLPYNLTCTSESFSAAGPGEETLSKKDVDNTKRLYGEKTRILKTVRGISIIEPKADCLQTVPTEDYYTEQQTGVLYLP